ncbi:MAG: hypothetical protein ACXABD_21030 [Candidatus Thorarchaeota archaeon]|jgi:hypothetical protein
MATHKLSGNQVILGGATILSAPTIYASAYSLLSTSSTGVFKIYGEPAIENTTTDKQVASIKLAGLRHYIQKVPFTFANFQTTTITTNFDSGKDVPAGAMVKDAWFDILTVGTSGTITAGTDVDPNGFLTGIGIQTATAQVGSVTAGSVTYGALLVDKATTTIGSWAKVNYVATGAKNIMIGRSATTLTAGLVGDLYIEYVLPATS